eukprot:scaffold2498_cov114-Isochrysis_galbana.AAC.6
MAPVRLQLRSRSRSSDSLSEVVGVRTAVGKREMRRASASRVAKIRRRSRSVACDRRQVCAPTNGGKAFPSAASARSRDTPSKENDVGNDWSAATSGTVNERTEPSGRRRRKASFVDAS